MKKIAICADDYGLSPAISEGILTLVEQQRLTSVSCITTQHDWTEHAKQIRVYKKNVELGLHFNLTEGPLLKLSTAYSLPKILSHSHLRLLSKQDIKAELMAQLEAFVESMGSPPDFFDGHQHVHHLPVIRDILLETIDELGLSTKWIRSAIETKPLSKLKSFIIKITGANKFRKLLDAHNIPHNSDFAGIYSFANYQDFPAYFDYFLKNLKDGGLLMCHPGLLGAHDPIGTTRFAEWSYLMSEAFSVSLLTHDIELKTEGIS